MKNASHKLDIGKILIIGSALFQAYQFGRALNVYDPQALNVAGMNIGGLILGAIVNVSVAWASTQLPSISGKARMKSAWSAYFILLILSPALIAPALWMLFKPLPIGSWSLFLAIGLAIAPDLTISLSGFVAGKALIPLPVHSDNLPKVAVKKSKPVEILPQIKRKRITDAELLAHLAEKPGETQEAVAQFFGVTRQAIGSRMKTLYAVKKDAAQQ